MIPCSLPKNRSARRSSARRVNRRAAAFSLALATMLAGVLPFGQRAQAADTVSTVIAGATDLSDPNSYTPTVAPTATSDVLFTGTYTTPTFNVNGAALTYGTLDDISTQALTIGDTTGTPGSITLSSVANLTTSTGAGNAADVLFVKSGSNLTINNVAVNIATPSANNINSGGTLTFGATSTLSLGTTATTFSGAGTATINGTVANTSGGLTVSAGAVTLAGTSGYTGATTLTAGTLNLNSATALGGLMDPNFGTTSGTSGLLITTGTINNTSGAALTLAYNAPISFGANNFNFGTAASTSANNLNLGTGAISMSTGRTINVLGTGTTFTMGGVLSYTGTTTTAPTAGNSTTALTVNGAGNTLSLGGIAIDASPSSTTATVLGLTGSGIINVTGAITNGNALANGMNFGSGSSASTLNISGNNTYTGLTTFVSGSVNLSGDNSGVTGSATVNGAAVNLGSATAFGNIAATSAISLAAGSINNTSGTPIVFGGAATPITAPISLTNFFAFDVSNAATATNADNINLGNGTLSMNTNRQLAIGGTGVTVTFGGTVNNTGGGLTLVAQGNTLAFAGSTFNLTANTGTTTGTYTIAGAGNVFITGAVANSSVGTATGASALVFNGPGMLVLSGANTYTGATQVAGGTLNLDYATTNGSKLSTTAALTIGGVNTGSGVPNTQSGGVVNLVGGTFAQTVGSTTLGYGADVITRAVANSTLALGAITRNTGASIDFGTSSGYITTTTGNTNGILGGYATVGGTDFATLTGGTPVAYTGYTNATGTIPGNITPTATGNGDANNVQLTGGGALGGNVVTNSLKIASATGTAQTLNLGTGQSLNLTSGGLLYTGSDAYTINGGALRTNVATATGNDLIVHQYGTGTLTINSAITDGNFGSSTLGSPAATSLTKAGPGTLILGGADSYTGNTYVNAGTLQLGAANSLFANSAVLVNGTLDLHGFSQTVDNIDGTGMVTNNGTGAATLTIGNNNGTGGVASTFYGAINNGTGTLGLTKAGSNTITLQGVNTYRGATLVAGGTLNVQGLYGSIANSSSISVTGGTLAVGDNNGAAGRINPNLALNLGGGNGGGVFSTGRIEGGVQTLNMASLNIGTGTNSFTNFQSNQTADSGFLLITGPSSFNYTRSAGGFFVLNSGGGNQTLGFTNAPGGAVSGIAGSTAIVIGGASNGSNSSFVTAGTGGNLASFSYATSSVLGGTSLTANSNTILTNTAATATAVTDTISTATTVNSLQIAAATTAGSTTTLTLNANLTIASGGLLAGTMPITSVPTINGTGTLSTGSAQDLWIYNNTINGTSTPIQLTIAVPITDLNTNAATNDLTGGISKGGGGTTTLTGASTFSGPIYLTQGILAINNTNATGTASALGNPASTAPIFMLGSGSTGNATLQASTTALTTIRPIVLGGGTGQATIDSNGQTVTLSGVISSTGTQSTNVAQGSGELLFTSTVAGGKTILTAANTFTGGTSVGSTNETLVLANQNALQNSTLQTNVGGTLQFDQSVTGNAFSIGALGNNTGFALANNATTPAPITLTIGNNNLNATSTAAMTGAGSVVKVGTGTQTFTGNNTFTGTLTVSGGTVNLPSSNAFTGTTGLRLNTGGTLLLSGTTTTRILDTAPVTMAGGTISLVPGAREGTALNRTGAGTTSQTSPNAAGVGMLTLAANSTISFAGTSGTLVIGTGAASAFDPTNAGAGNFTLTVLGTNFGTGTLDGESINDRLVFNQTAAPTTAQLNDIFFNQGGTLYSAAAAQIGTTTYYDIIPGAIAAVPEPSTWVAGLLCLGTLGFTQRRRIGSFLRNGQTV